MKIDFDLFITEEIKASYPLRQREAIVTDVPGEPGSYNPTVFVQPHFQLAELTDAMRLVTHLAK